jgi:hypothetical protein
MKDSEHKANILAVTKRLNEVQDAARRDGLKVEVRLSQYQGSEGGFKGATFLLEPVILRIL